MMWFFNFKKKGKGEEPKKTEVTDARVSSAKPNDALQDIACSIRCARAELDYARYYGERYFHIIKKLDDAEEKCNVKQIWDAYNAIEDAVGLLEEEYLHQGKWYGDYAEYNPIPGAIRELRDAQRKCHWVW